MLKRIFFVSIEQDVLLNPRWFSIIPDYMKEKKVAVAQGIEVPTNRAEKAMLSFVIKKIRQVSLKDRSKKFFSIGNNIYKTNIIRKLGFVDDPVSMSAFSSKIYTGHCQSFQWIVKLQGWLS